MRVRYLGPSDSEPPAPEDGRYHLVPGREYAVLEVHIRSNGSTSLRIEHAPGDLAGLYSGSYFEQTSGVIPTQWYTVLHSRGGLSLGPKEWILGEFWERMMERDSAAEASFESTRDAIRSEDPIL